MLPYSVHVHVIVASLSVCVVPNDQILFKRCEYTDKTRLAAAPVNGKREPPPPPPPPPRAYEWEIYLDLQ